MDGIRGNQISMIFQEPMTSLNPLITVGEQVGETIRFHQKLGRKPAREKSIEMLRLVEMPDPGRRVDSYPHQLSGGMRQRAMIAIALSCRPALLIADEPTTALDVTVQAQILELIGGLQHDLGMALLLITHDLGVVAEPRPTMWWLCTPAQSSKKAETTIFLPAAPSLHDRLAQLPAEVGRETEGAGSDPRHSAGLVRSA